MIHLDQTQLNALLDKPLFHLIGEEADRLGYECYVVGGYVRDLFLQRPSKDIDVVVVGSGIEMARAVAHRLGRKAHLSVFKNFGTAQIKINPTLIPLPREGSGVGTAGNASSIQKQTTPLLREGLGGGVSSQGQRSFIEIEFVGARRESYSHDSRKPIVEDGTLEDDQNRRDFTINAMAICLNTARFGELVDPFDGVWDLEDRIIATPLDPDITFSDDPLRMMRCIRFATQLNFEIEDETFEALSRNRERIRIISQERVIEELQKIMASDSPARGFELLFSCGLLELIFPELYALHGVETVAGTGHKDNFWHTLQVLTNVVGAQKEIAASQRSEELQPTAAELPQSGGMQITSPDKTDTMISCQRHNSADIPQFHAEGVIPPQSGNCSQSEHLFLRWAALLHDIGKPRSKRWEPGTGWTFHNHDFIGQKMIPEIFRRMKLPMDERMKYVQKLVGLHMRPIAIADDEVTDSAVRRLLFEAGDDIDDLMLLCEADITTHNDERKQRFLHNFQLVRQKLIDLEERDRIRNFQPPVSGEEIMSRYGLSPSKEVGILKEAIKNAILDGLVPNEHDAALQFVDEQAQKMGLPIPH